MRIYTVLSDESSLPGVTITTTDENGTQYETVTDVKGRGELRLGPGEYEIVGELSGLDPVRKSLSIREGTVCAIWMTFELGDVSEIIVTDRSSACSRINRLAWLDEVDSSVNVVDSG